MPELTEKEQALYHEIKKIGPEGLLRSKMDKDQILTAEGLFKRSVLMKGTTKEKRVAYFLPSMLMEFCGVQKSKR